MPERFGCTRCGKILDFEDDSVDFVRVKWAYEHVKCAPQPLDHAAREGASE
jgi:hypothetical protein